LASKDVYLEDPIDAPLSTLISFSKKNYIDLGLLARVYGV